MFYNILFGIFFGGYKKKQYLCTVFFMVLDLRLSRDWVVGMTILLFLYIRIRKQVEKNRIDAFVIYAILIYKQ